MHHGSSAVKLGYAVMGQERLKVLQPTNSFLFSFPLLFRKNSPILLITLFSFFKPVSPTRSPAEEAEEDGEAVAELWHGCFFSFLGRFSLVMGEVAGLARWKRGRKRRRSRFIGSGLAQLRDGDSIVVKEGSGE